MKELSGCCANDNHTICDNKECECNCHLITRVECKIPATIIIMPYDINVPKIIIENGVKETTSSTFRVSDAIRDADKKRLNSQFGKAAIAKQFDAPFSNEE